MQNRQHKQNDDFRILFIGLNSILIAFLIWLILIGLIPGWFRDCRCCICRKAMQLFYNAKKEDYSPAKTLISAIGLGGFAINSITATRARRSHGILHDQLMRFFFPLYASVYVLHVVYVLLGLYASERSLPILIGCCSLGASVCFLYSMLIMLCTEYDQQFNMAMLYIYAMIKRRTESCGLAANDIAVHIHESFQNSSSTAKRTINAGERIDLKLLMFLLKPRKIRLKDSGEIAPDFSEKSKNPTVWMWNMLYGVPLNTGKYSGTDEDIFPRFDDRFGDLIRKSCAIWESCARSKGTSRLEKTAGTIIAFAFEKDDCQERAYALICGLLLYLRLNLPNESNSMKNQWNACCGFLSRMLNTVQGMQRDCLQKMRKSVSLMTCSLLCWEQYILIDEILSPSELDELMDQIGLLAGNTLDQVAVNQLDTLCTYTACAFEVCRLYSAKDCQPLDRRNIARWYPMYSNRIVFAVRHCYR